MGILPSGISYSTRAPDGTRNNNVDMDYRESDAILLYLVERYDPEHKLSVAEGNDKFTLMQWLFFQASGQGCVFHVLVAA